MKTEYPLKQARPYIGQITKVEHGVVAMADREIEGARFR